MNRKQPLKQRDLDTLYTLAFASRDSMRAGGDGWMLVQQCGGIDGSHHTRTLAKLVRHGMAECKQHGINKCRRFRVTFEGLARLVPKEEFTDENLSRGPNARHRKLQLSPVSQGRRIPTFSGPRSI